MNVNNNVIFNYVFYLDVSINVIYTITFFFFALVTIVISLKKKFDALPIPGYWKYM